MLPDLDGIGFVMWGIVDNNEKHNYMHVQRYCVLIFVAIIMWIWRIDP